MGILAMMVIPSNIGAQQSGPDFYGAATISQSDADGQELFSQTVHNRIVDTGEVFILDQTFQKSGDTDVANAGQIGSICISSDNTAPVEGLTAATFDCSCKIPSLFATSVYAGIRSPKSFLNLSLSSFFSVIESHSLHVSGLISSAKIIWFLLLSCVKPNSTLKSTNLIPTALNIPKRKSLSLVRVSSI